MLKTIGGDSKSPTKKKTLHSFLRDNKFQEGMKFSAFFILLMAKEQ